MNNDTPAASAPRRDSVWQRSAAPERSTTAEAIAASGGTAVLDPWRGSLSRVVDDIGARALWQRGVTGRGVGVAVIDTGVASVPELAAPGAVVAEVDLSAGPRGLGSARVDGHGHGTHMAGIIGGRASDTDPTTALGEDRFLGVAPESSLVVVKVGDSSGSVDVTQVVAGIDWVVAHRDELGIRVISLSYGTDSAQRYEVDPLAAAVERAWHAGVVVVVSAGNEGPEAGRLTNPAIDPFVIAVGAAEHDGTAWGPETNTSSGDGVRNPDLAAPGKSIVSLRAPGSLADRDHPEGYVDETLFKGTGSSQAAAVVAGSVALLLDARPHLSPDEVKALLTSTAQPLGDQARLGRGLVAVDRALAAHVPAGAAQTWTRSTGAGSLDGARGSDARPVEVVSVPELTWGGYSWGGYSWGGYSWGGYSWGGYSWGGYSWGGYSWG